MHLIKKSDKSHFDLVRWIKLRIFPLKNGFDAGDMKMYKEPSKLYGVFSKTCLDGILKH